jgi:hypothetical protein
MRPTDRLERLLRHTRSGWERISLDATERDAALRWLARHPSSWPELDQLWQAALQRRGPLAEWLDAGADPRAWSHVIALHSVLASHPFASLSAWSTPARSNRS